MVDLMLMKMEQTLKFEDVQELLESLIMCQFPQTRLIPATKEIRKLAIRKLCDAVDKGMVKGFIDVIKHVECSNVFEPKNSTIDRQSLFEWLPKAFDKLPEDVRLIIFGDKVKNTNVLEPYNIANIPSATGEDGHDASMECNNTNDNIAKFVKWAVVGSIPLPEEIINIVKSKTNVAEPKGTEEPVKPIVTVPEEGNQAAHHTELASNILINYAMELGSNYIAQSQDQTLPGIVEMEKHLKKCFKKNKPTENELELLHKCLGEYQQQKAMSIKMSEVAEKANPTSKKIKTRIEEVVKESIKPPCVCLHDQMKNRIVNGFLDPDTGKCLWIDNDKVSESVLLDTVRKAYKDAGNTDRINAKKTIFPLCPVHD